MISHGGISELYNREMIKALGIKEDQFFALPYEYQKALIMGRFEEINKDQKLDNLRKARALKQYLFEEKVKEKVLSLFKKNR